MIDGPPRVLLVGGGMTSAIIARLLQSAVLAGRVELHVWEKGRGLGGRMSVSRSTTGGRADMGAQYITEVEGVAGEHRELYAALESAGVLVPMDVPMSGSRAADGSGKNWVAPAGLNSVAKALLNASGARVAVNRALTSVERVVVSRPDGDPRPRWRVRGAAGSGGRVSAAGAPAAAPAPEEDEGLFDSVVLTMPAPQLLAQGGAVAEALLQHAELLGSLRNLQYSSRYAVALFYAKADKAAAGFLRALPWTCKYVSKEENDALVFVSKDTAKRGAEASEPPTLVLHSSVPYALGKMDSGATVAQVGAELLGKAQALLPGLPAPAEARTIIWRYSQVRTPIAPEGSPAAHAIVCGDAPLILAGDAFSKLGSRFDGCYESAHAAAEILRVQLRLPSAAPGAPASAL